MGAGELSIECETGRPTAALQRRLPVMTGWKMEQKALNPPTFHVSQRLPLLLPLWLIKRVTNAQTG